MEQKTILLVEDDDSFRESLRKVLERADYQILEATSGSEGIRLAAKEQIDLIILDFYLGDMTGADFLETWQEKKEPPVIVLSANIDREASQKALDLGVRLSLTKPIGRHELLAAVKSSLS